MRLCSCNLKVVWQFGEIATGISCSHSPTLRVFKIAFLLLLFSLCLFLFCLLHYFPSCPPPIPVCTRYALVPGVARASVGLRGASDCSQNTVDTILRVVLNTLYSKKMGCTFFFFNVLSHDSSAELKPPKWWVLNYKCFWKALLIY